MRLALLSNVTVGLLGGMLGKASEVYLPAGFDTWQQELMAPTSGLYGFKPETVVILLYADAYIDTWDDGDKGSQVIDGWIAAVRALVSRLPGIPVFISSIDVSNIKARHGAAARPESYFEGCLVRRVEELHREGANTYVLPVRDLIADLGRKNFYSPKMWYAGSMPYTMKGLAALAGLVSRYTSAAKGAKKKCIAIDLDNTLWGGVIGEDGVGGILLSNNKEGARYKDTQRLLKKMKGQGVMLAVLSKNNMDDVEPVFSHPDMVLHHEDFVAEAINWEPKTANIKQLAKALNIGLDSFVFLDDNPAEREQMKAECPEVAVIDFPKDTSLLPETVGKIYDDYFLSLDVTGEDAKKTDMYRSEAQRKAGMGSAASVEDFLKKLEMAMDIHFMEGSEEKRVVQLANKTNQFNVTTRRYSEDDIHRLARSADSDVITVHMADKYGDQGLVAVVILKYSGSTSDIDTFLMSCRVMGRDAEVEIMAQVKKMLLNKGIETVTATYIKTAKNSPVAELFEKFGFSIRENGDSERNKGWKEYVATADMLPETTGVFSKVIAFGESL